MAGITRGLISIDDVIRGDMFDLSFDVTHDLSNFVGKILYSEVRVDQDQDPILIFKESDSSLTRTVNSSTSFTIRFQKTALQMSTLDLGTYQITIVMGTSPDFADKQTIIDGTFTIVDEITEKPTA
jgi:hypothetical protein